MEFAKCLPKNKFPSYTPWEGSIHLGTRENEIFSKWGEPNFKEANSLTYLNPKPKDPLIIVAGSDFYEKMTFTLSSGTVSQIGLELNRW